MAFVSANIKLPEVGRDVAVRLYFPCDLPKSVGNKINGVITLLHGMGNTGDDWMQYSAAPRYAADNGYVLVAPSCDNSFYLNMRHGPPWYSMLAEWLPAQLHQIFNLPTEREKNFIAGLSMGGYGAFRMAMLHPDRYAAAGSFSGPLDLHIMAAQAEDDFMIRALLEPVLGEELAVPDDANLALLAKRVAALPKAQQPRLYASCGAQDDERASLRTQNLSFHAAVKDLALDYHYYEWDGVHEWNFWDRSFAEFIGFIQKSRYGQRKAQDWAHPVLSGAE